jgi:LmbE family N-acetylglucosaminyl deacetylase
LWGLANLFYGYRIYRVLLLVIFGLLGASVGLLLTREGMFYLQILAAAVGTLIFGLIAYYLYKLILILAGGLIMAIVAVTPAVQFSLPESAAWILGISGFVLGCGLAYIFKQYAIYLVSALWGASYVFSGAILITFGRNIADLSSLGSLAAIIEWVFWLALAAFGVYWQRKRLISLVLGLGVAGYLGLLRSQSPFLTLERPNLEDLEVLSLDGYERLLVLAPHSDDEGLGAAGLMMKAVEEGIDVRVVLLTNGDGFPVAAGQEAGTLLPSPQDFIDLGNQRQVETINAVGVLGVPAENISFLGYPDSGTPSMWYENWSIDNPYESDFTQTSRSPYENTYRPESVYAGEDLLGDIRDILEEYQPDLVVYPQGNDVHSDHWGLYNFARLALAINAYLDPNFNPDTYAYLVHRPDFPYPEEYNPKESLLPPVPIYHIYPDWYRLDLSDEEVRQKEAALEEYKSQIDLLWYLMGSFIRRNEVFTTHETVSLPELAQGEPFNPDSWVDAEGRSIEAVQLDPSADILERVVFPDADLKELYMARLSQDEFVACAETVADPVPEVTYVLHMRGIGFEGVIDRIEDGEPTYSTNRDFLNRRYFACSQFSLEALGNPVMVFAGAETYEEGFETVDQMAWQLVEIP